MEEGRGCLNKLPFMCQQFLTNLKKLDRKYTSRETLDKR